MEQFSQIIVCMLIDTRCAVQNNNGTFCYGVRHARWRYSGVIRLIMHHKFQVHADEVRFLGMQCKACVSMLVYGVEWSIISYLSRSANESCLFSDLLGRRWKPLTSGQYVYYFLPITTRSGRSSQPPTRKGTLCRNSNHTHWTQV